MIFLRSLILAAFLLLAFPVTAVFAAEAQLEVTGAATVHVGDIFPVTIRGSDLEAVDTIRLNGAFSSSLMSWDYASPQGVFQHVSPGTFVDAKTGAFSFGSYSFDQISAAGDLVTVYFKAIRAGRAEVNLDQTTRVYQDGTEQALSRKNLNFQILPEVPKLAGFLRAQSASHPDMMAWYRTKEVDLAWTVTTAQKYQVMVGLDQLPRGLASQRVQGKSIKLRIPTDGVWYAHVQVTYADGKKEQVDLPIRVDTTAPSVIQPVIEPVHSEKSMGHVLRFSALDDLSGMRGYEVFVNDVQVTSTALTSVTLGALEPGDWMVRVVGTDLAGNAREASLIYHVASTPGVASTGLARTGLAWWWILLFLLILLLLVLWMWAVRETALSKPRSKPFRKKKK